MTLFFAVGGVDIGNAAVRLEGGIASLTAYANGSVATAGVEVDDPTGALTFIDLQTFTVTETACTAAPRCFTGYIYNIRQKRGPFRNGAGRVWMFDVGDLNFLLHLQKTRGASGKRPRETIDARVAWLMSTSGMSGIVFDNGMVASRGASMVDEADYRKNYHDEVWQDISTGWIFFVYYDQATGQPSMFFDDPTATTNTSTLTISNVLSDVNNTTCFAPNEDSELLMAGEDIYCAVDFTYIGDANIYRHNQTTHDAFFTDPNFHRVGDVTSSRVGRLATAEAEATRFLELHSGQINTITHVVQLPASKVNLIDSGMRVLERFSHFSGYATSTPLRVNSRTLTLAAGTNEYYDVQLELSMKGIGQLSSGSPGDFPKEPCVPQEHWWAETFNIGPGAPGLATTGASSETRNFEPITDYDWSVSVTEAKDGVDNPGGFQAVAIANVIGATGDPGRLLLANTFANAPQTGTFTTSNLVDNTVDYSAFGTSLSPGGSIILTGTVTFWIDPVGWVPVDCADNPPGGAEPVPPEFIANGDGTTTLFHTLFPYAPGSLKVWVDGHPILLGLTETDPATGAFTIDFAPLPAQGDTPAEVVTAAYQGAAGGSTSIIGFGAHTVEVAE